MNLFSLEKKKINISFPGLFSYKGCLELFYYTSLIVGLLLFGSGMTLGYTVLELWTVALFCFLLFCPFSQTAIEKCLWKNPFFWILVTWVGYLFLQWLPVTSEFLEMISPERNTFLEYTSLFEEDEHKLYPLTFYNYFSRVALLKLLMYTGIFFFVLNFFQSKQSLRRFCQFVVFLSFGMCFLGLFYYQIDSTKIYGIYSFSNSIPLTPYVNRNHFANILAMTTPITLSLIFLTLDKSKFMQLGSLKEKFLGFFSGSSTSVFLYSSILVVQLYTLFFTASRGGILAFFVSLFVFSFFLILKKRSLLVLGALTGVALLFVVALVNVTPLLQKFSFNSDFLLEFSVYSRLRNWQDALTMFFDFPIVGVGAGAFRVMIPFYKSMPQIGDHIQIRSYNTENDYIQALAELGIVGSAILVLFVLVLTFRFISWWFSYSKKTYSWLSLGLFSALIAMTVHSLVDYPTNFPFNMFLASSLAGALVSILSLGDVYIQDTKPTNKVRSSILFLLLMLIFLPILSKQFLADHIYFKARDLLKEASVVKEDQYTQLTKSYQGFLKANAWDKKQSRIHYSLGLNEIYLGKLEGVDSPEQIELYQRAEKSLIEAIQLSPMPAPSWYSLGWLYELRQQHQEAHYYLEKAHNLESYNPYYTFQLAKNEMQLGQESIAFNLFKKAIQSDANYTEDVISVYLYYNPSVSQKYLETLAPEGQYHEHVKDRVRRYFSERLNQSPVSL